MARTFSSKPQWGIKAKDAVSILTITGNFRESEQDELRSRATDIANVAGHDFVTGSDVNDAWLAMHPDYED